MSALAVDPSADVDGYPRMTVYWCLKCGPCYREIWPAGAWTMHRDVDHGPAFEDFDDDEDNPQ